MPSNKCLQGLLGLLTVALIIFVGAKARNAFEEYNYIGKIVRDRDMITIDGEGKITAKPDIAKVMLGVRSEGTGVKETQLANTKKMNEILSALKKLGVAEKDIQTAQYNIYPKQAWKDGTSRIVGYHVSQEVTVKIRDLDKIGDVLAQSGDLGANHIGGIQFTIDDPKRLQDQARVKAIEDSRTKAHELAKQLGQTIVRVVTFYENREGETRPYPAAVQLRSMGQQDAFAAPTPQIESGSLDVISRVSVTFEVR